MTDHISHDRAEEALQRFIDGSFGRRPGPRRSIPARPGEDDDLVLADYIAQRRWYTVELSKLRDRWLARSESVDFCDDGHAAFMECIDGLTALLVAEPAPAESMHGRAFCAAEITAIVRETGRGILRFEIDGAMLALLPTGDVVFNGRLLGNDPAILEALSTLAAGVDHGWRPKSETPPPGSVALLYFDVGDNTGAGLDEVYSVGWNDGDRWHDVHSDHDRDPSPWLHSWRLITPAAPDRSAG